VSLHAAEFPPTGHQLPGDNRYWVVDRLVFIQELELSELDLHYLSPSFARGMFFLPTYVTRAYEIHPEILTDQNMIASEIS
jgi:hypothetical protein